MKPGRQWVPIDVTFWHDPQVVAAGEPAGVLYQVILCHLRANNAREGAIQRGAIPLLAVNRWQQRLAALERVGLVKDDPERDGWLVLPAWESWQSTRARYMREYRARRANRPQDVVPRDDYA